MDPAVLTAEFNALPRKPNVPSGQVSNSWHFSLRHVQLNPPGTLLYIINPGSRYAHVEGPIPPTVETEPLPLRAAIYATLLLKAFNADMGSPPGEGVKLGRPWNWSTDDAELAGAVGEILRGWGVTDGLDQVGVATEEENKIAAEQWESFLGGLKGMIEGSK